MMMTLQTDMAAIEVRLKAAGKTVGQLCNQAEIARSTWDRWRRGETEPNTKTWRTVCAALDIIDPQAGEDAA